MTISSTLHGALDAIRAAIPGCVGLQFEHYDTWSAVRIRVDSDEAVCALAAALGIERVECANFSGRWWMTATNRDGNVETTIDGPHHDGAPPQLDERALDEAAEQARAAATTFGVKLGNERKDGSR